MTPPFRRVLVANRGEIALRIIRACHEMGMEAVAVYSRRGCLGGARARRRPRRAARAAAGRGELPADRRAWWPPRSTSGAEAVHPGYGFLSEREAFARAVEDAGLAWVGPPPAVIAALGDKLAARRIAREAGVPHVPGTLEPALVDGPDQVAAVLAAAREVGLSAPGEGRGRRRRAGDAPRRGRRRAGRRPAGRLARGGERLRRRLGLPGARDPAGAPRRGAAAGRRGRATSWRSASGTARSSGATRS